MLTQVDQNQTQGVGREHTIWLTFFLNKLTTELLNLISTLTIHWVTQVYKMMLFIALPMNEFGVVNNSI